MIYPIVQQLNVDEIVQKVLPEIQGEIESVLCVRVRLFR